MRRLRRLFAGLGVRRRLEGLHAAGSAAVDDVVEPSLAERDVHLLVLALHQLAHLRREMVGPDQAGVAAFDAPDDAAAVGKDVRDDVGSLDARVLGLDVEDQVPVLDVVVVTDLCRPPDAGLFGFGLDARERLERPLGAEGREHGAVADALHLREGGLRERIVGAMPKRLCEELVAVGIVLRRRPDGQHLDGVVLGALLEENFRDAHGGVTGGDEIYLRFGHQGLLALITGRRSARSLRKLARCHRPRTSHYRRS